MYNFSVLIKTVYLIILSCKLLQFDLLRNIWKNIIFPSRDRESRIYIGIWNNDIQFDKTFSPFKKLLSTLAYALVDNVFSVKIFSITHNYMLYVYLVTGNIRRSLVIRQ
jgi:hypothetical protein